MTKKQPRLSKTAQKKHEADVLRALYDLKRAMDELQRVKCGCDGVESAKP